eukprot:scaffold15468_cov111-Isochrysis_galbana.AAC.5
MHVACAAPYPYCLPGSLFTVQLSIFLVHIQPKSQLLIVDNKLTMFSLVQRSRGGCAGCRSGERKQTHSNSNADMYHQCESTHWRGAAVISTTTGRCAQNARRQPNAHSRPNKNGTALPINQCHAPGSSEERAKSKLKLNKKHYGSMKESETTSTQIKDNRWTARWRVSCGSNARSFRDLLTP